MKSDTLHCLCLAMLALAMIPAAYIFMPSLIEILGELKERFLALDGDAIACAFFALFTMLSVCLLVAGMITENTEKKEALAELEGRKERLRFENEQIQAHSDSR